MLAAIEFPLPGMERKYSPSDIMEIGFTDRTALVIVLKDSLCLTYDLTGEPLLPPFHLLPKGDGKGTELYQATVFEGGAVRIRSVSFEPGHDVFFYCPPSHSFICVTGRPCNL